MAQMWIGPQNGLLLASLSLNSTSATIAAVPAVAGQVIRVYKIFLVVAGTTNLTFQDGTTALTGAMPMASNGSIVLDNSGTPWVTTTSGNAFNIVNSGSVQVSGAVFYTQSNS